MDVSTPALTPSSSKSILKAKRLHSPAPPPPNAPLTGATLAPGAIFNGARIGSLGQMLDPPQLAQIA